MAFDLVAVVVGAGQTPVFFARDGHGVEEASGSCVVVREEAGIEQAERHADRSGKSGGIDQVCGSEGFSVVQAVGEDEAALGVGVHNFDGLAGHGSDHVAGTKRLSVGHVFRGANDGEYAHGGLQLRDGAHGADHGSGSGHVVLHLVHVVGGLDRNASGVEGDPFTDEAEDDVVRIFWSSGRWFVANDDERGRLCRALRDGGEGTHFQFENLVPGVDFARQAEFRTHRGRAFAKFGGRQDVAWLVDQGACEILRFCNHEACTEPLLHFGLTLLVVLARNHAEILNA